ncbi:hypothetical protein X875_310 [Mannheimia varigena USDA-ARS-USMARC-1388]|nr:hypothetical protein X875_310 [Mannheimia varigena USDA-ARS-USMARC-1388]
MTHFRMCGNILLYLLELFKTFAKENDYATTIPPTSLD